MAKQKPTRITTNAGFNIDQEGRDVAILHDIEESFLAQIGSSTQDGETGRWAYSWREVREQPLGVSPLVSDDFYLRFGSIDIDPAYRLNDDGLSDAVPSGTLVRMWPSGIIGAKMREHAFLYEMPAAAESIVFENAGLNRNSVLLRFVATPVILDSAGHYSPTSGFLTVPETGFYIYTLDFVLQCLETPSPAALCQVWMRFRKGPAGGPLNSTITQTNRVLRSYRSSTATEEKERYHVSSRVPATLTAGEVIGPEFFLTGSDWPSGFRVGGIIDGDNVGEHYLIKVPN